MNFGATGAWRLSSGSSSTLGQCSQSGSDIVQPQGGGDDVNGIKSDSETSPDCATRIAQLFGRIAQLGLRNLDCATPRIAQLCLRNS